MSPLSLLFSGLGLFSLEERRLGRNLVAVYNYMVKGFREDRARLFVEVHNGRTRSNKLKM